MSMPPLSASASPGLEADAYQRHAAFVPALAGDVVALLAPRPGERILDLGCGDGVLTATLAAAGADVLGVDISPSMVAATQARGLPARQWSGDALDFHQEFDAVFSNAALHWMHNASAVAAGVFAALKPGGRFVGEMGGHGNVAAIVVALRAVLWRRGLALDALPKPWFFPTAAEYRTLLEQAGFQVGDIRILARPTPLATGITGHLETFAAAVFARLPEAERDPARAEAEALLRPALCDQAGNWTADYVRLRFAASRPA